MRAAAIKWLPLLLRENERRNKMPLFIEKQIEQARSVDLLTYLQTHEPTKLVHVRGNTYCTREHVALMRGDYIR